MDLPCLPLPKAAILLQVKLQGLGFYSYLGSAIRGALGEALREHDCVVSAQGDPVATPVQLRYANELTANGRTIYACAFHPCIATMPKHLWH